MSRIKKNKITVKKNKGLVTSKNITENHKLENRETLVSINKMVSPSLNNSSRCQPINTGMGKHINDGLDELYAKDIMQREICWCTLDTSVEQAMEEFNRYKCSHIAVGQNNNLHGLLSQKDLLEAKSPYLKPEFAKWRRPLDYASLKIKINWLVKNKQYQTIRTDENIKAVMRKMLWTKSECIAVLDKLDKFVGIITVEDIFDNLLAYNEKNRHERIENTKHNISNSNISKAIAELLEHSNSK